MDGIDRLIRRDGNARGLHVNAPATVDAWQHAAFVSQSPGANCNAAFITIDQRARRRTDLPGARQRRRCWSRR